MPSASFHGPSRRPLPQSGLTSEITPADGLPNGPHALCEALPLVAPAHENRNATIARQMILFTTALQTIKDSCRQAAGFGVCLSVPSLGVMVGVHMIFRAAGGFIR